MKSEGRTSVELKQMNGAKRGFTLLNFSLGLAAGVAFLHVYIVRELLLFVACAALLVFFAANLALLGILFHAVVRSLVQFVREPKTRIAQQEEAYADSMWVRLSCLRQCAPLRGLAVSERVWDQTRCSRDSG
jgi:hypothetical protein